MLGHPRKITCEVHDIDDISPISLGVRKDHYRKQYGAYDMPMGQERLDVSRLADAAARDEMLQEVHSMLLHLINLSKEGGE